MADNNFIGGIHYEMMRRCYNENSITYKNYGAKGIRVCDEWHDREVFRKWCIDNGFSKGMTVKRKDTKKDYSPANCYLEEIKRNPVNKKYRESNKKHKELKAKLGITYVSTHPLYRTFISMKTRCYDPKHIQYHNYGGRGIKVCDEWMEKDGIYAFIEWALKSGWRPNLTLDRIDNEAGYSPDNCRWATRAEQARNKRTTRLYKYQGFDLTIPEISRKYNISARTIRSKMQNGLSLDDAVAELRSKAI